MTNKSCTYRHCLPFLYYLVLGGRFIPGLETEPTASILLGESRAFIASVLLGLSRAGKNFPRKFRKRLSLPATEQTKRTPRLACCCSPASKHQTTLLGSTATAGTSNGSPTTDTHAWGGAAAAARFFTPDRASRKDRRLSLPTAPTDNNCPPSS